MVTPYVIINLSSTENLYVPKKHVVAFADKDDTDGEVFEIDSLDTAPRNGFLRNKVIVCTVRPHRNRNRPT